jgi:DNA invertase Pin-like site-specific DNA recombinase
MRTLFYGRYSSDEQRAASIDDQLRNCVSRCDREGWPRPVAFADRAVTGARIDRPEYLRLLAELRAGDVLLVDDLSRFGRDAEEIARAVKRLRFAGARLVGVSDGVDTARESHKLDIGLRGLMAEAYLDDLAKKTHRGLTGRALAGASAGGLPYGYRVAGTGQREIDEAQAIIVRRIYADYLDGRSARQIALALNREGVPSPRRGAWAVSAVYGDVRRGIGILANPIYCGRQVWNRSQWIKHPETGRRLRRERPESEWIVTEHPGLAIVDAETFDAVQARLRSRAQPNGGGSLPRHLLSGILRCGACGAPMTIVDRYRYGCSRAKNRGTCSSRVRVPRKAAETALLAGIRQNLLSEEAFQQFQRDAIEEMKRTAPDPAAARAALAAAEKVRDNILAALRAGIITPSTRAELIAAETAIEQARKGLAAVRKETTVHLLPRAREVWRGLVTQLDNMRDVPKAREAIHEMIGTASVIQQDGAIYAELGASEIRMVAGAGFGRYLTKPTKVLLCRLQGRKV